MCIKSCKISLIYFRGSDCCIVVRLWLGRPLTNTEQFGLTLRAHYNTNYNSQQLATVGFDFLLILMHKYIA